MLRDAASPRLSWQPCPHTHEEWSAHFFAEGCFCSFCWTCRGSTQTSPARLDNSQKAAQAQQTINCHRHLQHLPSPMSQGSGSLPSLLLTKSAVQLPLTKGSAEQFLAVLGMISLGVLFRPFQDESPRRVHDHILICSRAAEARPEHAFSCSPALHSAQRLEHTSAFSELLQITMLCLSSATRGLTQSS